MEVEIGKEGLKFENGAFTYYGVSALTAPSSGKLGTPLGAGGGVGWALQGGLPGDLLALSASWLCGGEGRVSSGLAFAVLTPAKPVPGGAHLPSCPESRAAFPRWGDQ